MASPLRTGAAATFMPAMSYRAMTLPLRPEAVTLRPCMVTLAEDTPDADMPDASGVRTVAVSDGREYREPLYAST